MFKNEFYWSIRESLHLSNTYDQPAYWKMSLCLARGILAAIAVGIGMLINYLLGGIPLGRILAALVILVALRYRKGIYQRGAMVLSTLVVKATENPDGDAQRRAMVMLITWIVRPILVFALCYTGRMLWIIPVVVLGEMVVIDAMDTPAIDGAKPTLLASYGHWLVALAVTLLACVGMMHWVPGGRVWIILGILCFVIAYVLPFVLFDRIWPSLKRADELTRVSVSVVIIDVVMLLCGVIQMLV